MSTLYRKYRPATFADLTGQPHIVQTITNEIKLGTVPHAFLFSGPRGIGKTTTARLMAKAVNCLQRTPDNAEPCNKCSSCLDIAAGRHIDVMEVDAASQTGVDNVRENIIENAQFKPTSASYKVFIIDEVHMLSTHAFNALLKTLEEPPAQVIFILATTELHKLPATVISRCQRFTFKKIGYDDMLARLKKLIQEEGVEVEQPVLDRIIHKSDGSERDAESLLGQVLSLHLKKITAEDADLLLPTSAVEAVVALLEYVMAEEIKEALTLIGEQTTAGINIDHFFNDLLETLRTILLLHTTAATDSNLADYSEAIVKRLKKIAKSLSARQLIFFIETAIKRRLDVKNSPLPQLPLELLVVEMNEALARPNTNGLPPAPAKNLIANESIIPQIKKTEPTPNTAASTGLTQTIKNALAYITNNEPITTTLEQIKTQWTAIKDTVGQTNHSLTFILSMAELVELTGNSLCLAIPYAFHQEKIEEKKNRVVVEAALFAVLQEKITIHCQLKSSATAEPRQTVAVDATLSALAMEFGGEVVG